jgi:hypothetical protein
MDSEEISKSRFNTLIGLIDRERIDAELYDDYETEKARDVSGLYLRSEIWQCFAIPKIRKLIQQTNYSETPS